MAQADPKFPLFISAKERPQDTPTAFRQIEQWAAGLSQPIWKAVAFVNGWGNLLGTYQPVQYTKDAFGYVRLRGVASLTGTGPGGFSTVFTLPAGYRPAATEIFNQTGDSIGSGSEFISGYRLDILSNGDVRVYLGSPTNPYVSLSSITFYGAA